MVGELQGKGAIVTEGHRVLVVLLCSHWPRLVRPFAVLDRDEDGVRATVSLVKESGANAIAVPWFSKKLQSLHRQWRVVLEQLGRIDILINNAGVNWSFSDITGDGRTELGLCAVVNLKAAMLLMKHVARHMIERGGGGRIVKPQFKFCLSCA
jgi:D-sorbitol dehydrogenase (acceptor)